jgi:oligogalacturonide lyase
VDNRIWGLDLATGKTWPIRPRTQGERVGHEYWHADGVHVGYHGEYPDGRKFFGRVRWDNVDDVEVDFPHQPGHIHSSDFGLIVGDGQGDPRDRVIRLWRWNETARAFDGPRVLCEHRGSFQVQQLHVHPRFSPDGRSVVFTSDRTGYGQVYEVEVGDFDDLPELGA